MDVLVNNGINVEKSLQILGDINLYNETMEAFISDSDSKLKNLISFKNQNDMANYTILMHALKSEADYLGFEKLADICYQHELTSKTNNVDFVNSHFEELINELNRIILVCKQYKGLSVNNELKGKILVVDDSSIIRNFVKKIFKDNYEVLTAENGNDAIEVIKNNSDILAVLLDLNMPECNGFEVLEYFKTNNLFRNMPVSLLTGDDTKESIDRAFKYPIVDMVSKPFNESSITAIVEKMISVHNF